MFTLVIGERRPEIWDILQRVFREEAGVELRAPLAHKVVGLRTVCAIITSGWFAHGHYGGIAPVGVAQVLSAQDDPYRPRWVVTTPLFPAHLVLDGSENATAVRADPNLSPEEEGYIELSKMFEATERHNAVIKTSNNRRLGCDLQFSGIHISDSKEAMGREVEHMGWAYRERFVALSSTA